MSSNILPTKRQSPQRGVFRKMYALTQPARKQRVAAAATSAEDLGGDVPGMGVSTSLMIIIAIHVVVIGGLFFHHRFLKGHGAIKAGLAEMRQQAPAATQAPVRTTAPSAPQAAAAGNREALPMIGPDDKSRTHIVSVGDNYERIAAAHSVDVNDLRVANNNVSLRSGMILRLPPRRIVAEPPAELVALRHPATTAPEKPEELVPVQVKPAAERTTATAAKPAKADARNELKSEVRTAPKESVASTAKKPTAVKSTTVAVTAPKAVKEKPTTTAVAKKPATTSSRRSYTVKSGDNIYRIASRLNVDQKALMKANGISDPSKLRAGAQLVVPN